jgi:predicted DNA-binding transcriptional regulator AlpA
MDNQITSDTLTVQQAAGALGRSEAMLRLDRVRGRGPRWFRHGKSIRYRRADIEAWIQEHLSPADGSLGGKV